MKERSWDVYFEIFGKKMKTTVRADSFYAAQCKVKDKIIFHKTEEIPGSEKTDIEEMFQKFGGMFK
jgi:hypothetical protein